MAMTGDGWIRVSRAQVRTFAAPETRTDDVIAGLVTRCDYVGAAAAVFARAAADEAVGAELVATILPGIRELGVAVNLIAVVDGDQAETWSKLVRERRFAVGPDVAPIELVVLYAAWRGGAERAALIPEVRRFARCQVGMEGYALLYTMASDIGDPTLVAALSHLRRYADHPVGRHAIATIDLAIARSTAAVLESLPAEEVPRTAVSGFTVRVGARVGRNEPCPCGSGKKYKRCCADKDARVAPSPVSGLSWDEYIVKAADRMSADEVRSLSLRDLCRVDLTTLAEVPLITAVRRFADERQWDRAGSALDALARVSGADTADDFRHELINEALHARAIDVAADHLGRLVDQSDVRFKQLELALLRRRPEALEEIVEIAEASLRDEDGIGGIELAHALLRTRPALGILVARGALHANRALDNEVLLAVIEDARDELNLPPGDRAWEVEAALMRDDNDDDNNETGQDRAAAAEASGLRASLKLTVSRVEQLERELEARQAELASPRRTELAPVRAPVAHDPAEADRERSLRAKIDELQGLVRAGNEERSDLRRQLVTVKSGSRATNGTRGSVTVAPVSNDDDGDGVACDTRERQPAVPSFTRRVQDAVRDVPRAIAADTLRLIGSLAAGDSQAWRSVKQAKDMPRQVLMARVGLHYRLCFRAESGGLEILDLVTRENLEATLKRLRTNRA